MKIFTRLQISISEKAKSSPVWTGEYLAVQVTISEKTNLHPSGWVKIARHEGESEERSVWRGEYRKRDFGDTRLAESSPVWSGEDSKHLHPSGWVKINLHPPLVH